MPEIEVKTGLGKTTKRFSFSEETKVSDLLSQWASSPANEQDHFLADAFLSFTTLQKNPREKTNRPVPLDSFVSEVAAKLKKSRMLCFWPKEEVSSSTTMFQIR